jgi:radical SAM protein with 4Fe4S-binding SPASM domain
VERPASQAVPVPAPLVPEVPFSELRDRLRLEERRVPIEGTLETTFRCNLNCVHCYVNEPVGDAEVKRRELSTERLEALIDEIAEAGCLNVLFTGGEVLVRPDFRELYLHAIRRGLLVTVFTNGTLVTDAVADLFDAYRPAAVEISLYGRTRETYEAVTRVPGSYDKCLAGIRRLVERGVPLKLKTMALTLNQHEVAAMQEFARGLGCEFVFDGLLNPRVDCGANRNGELQLSAEQVLALDLQDPERMRDFAEFCARFVPAPEDTREAEHVYQCGAGASSFTVDPYGQLQMCQLSRRSCFDLREDRFERGWKELFPRLRAREWQSRSVCRTCNLISLCGSCPGAAEMETGDVEALVPQFCEIAHLRAFAVLGEACGHRRDASCCLGGGGAAGAARGATEPTETGCGGCGAGHVAPAPGLIQLQLRR